MTFSKFFFLFFLAQTEEEEEEEDEDEERGRKKKSRTKKVPFVLQDSTTNLSNNYVPTRSSTTVVDAIIGSTPREAFRRPMQQQTTTPASAGDFDDAKKIPRRLGLVFGVGYYRSGERHGERFEIDRGAQFPPIIIIFFFVVRRPENYDSFSSFCFFRRSIDRERETRGRPPSSSILPQDHPTHPPTLARALSTSEGEKRGEKKKKKKKKKTTVWRTGFDSIRVFFFSFDDDFGRGGRRLSSNRIRLFFPTERKCLVSISFLFFSFLSRGREGRGRFFFNF